MSQHVVQWYMARLKKWKSCLNNMLQFAKTSRTCQSIGGCDELWVIIIIKLVRNIGSISRSLYCNYCSGYWFVTCQICKNKNKIKILKYLFESIGTYKTCDWHTGQNHHVNNWQACNLSKLSWCCGVVWCGVVWCGVVWCGVVWCGVVWCGVVWLDPAMYRLNDHDYYVPRRITSERRITGHSPSREFMIICWAWCT